jgi:hypothetical protein
MPTQSAIYEAESIRGQKIEGEKAAGLSEDYVEGHNV